MTTFFTDPFTGSNGAAWNASNWTVSNVSVVNTTGSSATIQGNKGRLNSGSSSVGKMAMRYSGTNVASAEYTGKFTMTTSVNGTLEVWLRAATGAVDGTGYVAQFDLGSSGNVQLIRANSYSYTTLASSSVTISQNVEYGFRVYAVGTSIKVKVWPTSGSEPGSYTLSATDSTVTAAGYSYIDAYGWGGSGFIVDLDDVTLTDGTGNQFTYTGSVTSTGVVKKTLVTKNPFTGSTTAVGVWSYQKVVIRAFAGSITAVGVVLRLPMKLLKGYVTGSGINYKSVPKTFASSITATGAFKKAFIKYVTGSITTVGTVVVAFLGRVLGRPGVAAVVIRAAGEAIARVRRN